MIGKNNAGKTTVVEALRIIGISLAKLKYTKVYNKRPEWLRGILGLAAKGTKISSNNYSPNTLHPFLALLVCWSP